MKDKKTIYSIVHHVSKSGMTRHISFFEIIDNVPYWLNHKIADALDMKFNKLNNALVVRGCGMDMAFNTVYNYGSATKDDGYFYNSRILG